MPHVMMSVTTRRHKKAFRVMHTLSQKSSLSRAWNFLGSYNLTLDVKNILIHNMFLTRLSETNTTPSGVWDFFTEEIIES